MTAKSPALASSFPATSAPMVQAATLSTLGSKSKKEFLIKQQEEQKQMEKLKKEYLLKQQKEQAQLEKSNKKPKGQKELEDKIENKQKSITKDSLSTQN